MSFALKCWSCGRAHIVKGTDPTMDCDLALAAKAIGMKSVFDRRYGRMRAEALSPRQCSCRRG